MADPKLLRVVVGQDNDTLDFTWEKDVAAIGGLNAKVKTGDQGVSYAGAGGEAVSTRYGIAIVAGPGQAIGGAGAVACAYDGGSARGGDGAVAWARRGGHAEVGAQGMASALDSTARAGRGSTASVVRQNAVNAAAHTASEGIAVVRNHPCLNPTSRAATASADTGGIAIAFDGNWVKGSLGALLVAAYTDGGQVRFTTGTVDGVTLKANQAYAVDGKGKFVEV